MKIYIQRIIFLCLTIAFIIITSCTTKSQVPTSPTKQIPIVTPTPTNLWTGLLLDMPLAFTTPLPESVWTPIDGTYAKLDTSEPQWWACRRCADYRPAGGVWKLQFDKGVMRIYYDVTGWRSIASYTVNGHNISIFNDPYCPEVVGYYTWKLEDKWGLEDRQLVLDVLNDSCSIKLRGENLSELPWDSCQPPNLLAGASDHWHKSPGCATILTPPPVPVNLKQDIDITIHPGYARKFAKPPDIYVDANKEEKQPPVGFTLAHSDNSISYGLNRVLWGEGSFVEISTELTLSAMGVQVYGDNTIGWARILFDGEEMWRGDTSEIWAYRGRNGGYIEITGFQPGRHTLRIESMGFDYHPVTVAFFGFNHQGSVEAEE